jgi:Tfp pilus assembly ATPase PilU
MTEWMEYLKTAVEHEASDVFFVAGKAACEKLEGHICPMRDVRLMPDDTEKITKETALLYADRPEQMKRNLQ